MGTNVVTNDYDYNKYNKYNDYYIYWVNHDSFISVTRKSQSSSPLYIFIL